MYAILFGGILAAVVGSIPYLLRWRRRRAFERGMCALIADVLPEYVASVLAYNNVSMAFDLQRCPTNLQRALYQQALRSALELHHPFPLFVGDMWKVTGGRKQYCLLSYRDSYEGKS